MTEEEKATQEAATKEIVDKINSVKDTPQFAAILNQHGKTYLESQESVLAAKYTGNAYNNVDTAYLEALGLENRPEGKSSDLVRKLGTDFLAVQAELKKLKDTKTGNNDDDIAKLQLHNTQLSALQTQIDDLTKENDGLTVKGKRQQATNSLVEGLTGQTYDPNLSNSVLTEIKTGRINNAVSKSKEVDGKIVYYMDDGNPYTNLNGLPMSAKEVGQVLFKDILHEKKAGGNATDDKKPHVKGDIVVIPNHQNITTFAQFNAEFAKAARARGLTKADKKWYELQIATSEHYKFKGLPME